MRNNTRFIIGNQILNVSYWILNFENSFIKIPYVIRVDLLGVDIVSA